MSTLASSSVPAAKAALVAAIRARQDAAGVHVCYGYPDDLSAGDIVAVMSVPDGRHTVRAKGLARREESYALDVVCSVFRGDADQQTVTERAVELAVLVEAALSDNPSLGGAVDSAEVGGRFTVNEADPRTLTVAGRVTEVHLRVQCENRAYE